jgi:hypothetical protein
MLSRLLAQENITIHENAQAKTAAFDLKNRVLILPVWQGVSREMEDMLLVHETGHALDTPSDRWVPAGEEIAKHVFGKDFDDQHKHAALNFLNIVEDVRIDKRQKRRYPGSRHDYVKAGYELLERDFFGLEKNNKTLEELVFADRFNIHFKAGIAVNVKFSDEEQVYVDRAIKTETFDEVVQLAKEIFAYSKQEIEKLMAENDCEGGEGQEGEGEGEGVPGEGQEGNGKTAQNGQSLVPTVDTEEAFQAMLKMLAGKSSKEIVHCNLPDPVLEHLVDDYKVVLPEMIRSIESHRDWRNLDDRPGERFSKLRNEVIKYRQSEKATISYMVKEFETHKAADTYSKISIARTGVIDTNKIHSYRYNDDVFRRNTVVPKGKNHGFVMFMDWSGSMASQLKNTLKQLYSLVMFCKQIQVPFEVYLFKDGEPESAGKRKWNYKTGLHNFIKCDPNLKLRNVLSSRMSLNELVDGMACLWAATNGFLDCDRLNGTPLNSAIVAASELVNQFRDRNKLQIVNTIFLTDGDSNYLGHLLNSDSSGKGGLIDSYVIHDHKTKHRFKIKNYAYGRSATAILLNMLKARTQSNLIGFFLNDMTWDQTLRYVILNNVLNNDEEIRSEYDSKDIDKWAKLWKSDGFFAMPSAGYDNYYIIKPQKIENQSFERFDQKKAKPIKSAKSLATHFGNYMEAKKVNRVLLRNFIDRICGQIFDVKIKRAS